MRARNRRLFPLVASLVLAGSAQANNVSGSVAETGTTWTKANSPYRVPGTLTVPPGDTLTIEPGVDVLFDADVQFVVQGSLNARGTASDSIRFLQGTAGFWKGVRISGGNASTLEYVRISGGYARGNEPDNRGGGLFVSGVGTRVDMVHCVITRNRAAQDGGGVTNDAADVTMTDCRVSDNSSEGEWSGAGGIFNLGILVMTNCTISGNATSGTGSGGAMSNVGSATLEGCLVIRNAAGYAAGAFNNSVSGLLSLTNCTISGNTSPSPGAVNNGSSKPVTMKNTIVWGNQPAKQITGASGSIVATYSDIQGGYTGTGNINADPLFVNPAAGDYRLQPESPCVDAGDPSSPVDRDGSLADIGVSGFSVKRHRLELPKLTAQPGTRVTIPIRASFPASGGVNCAFLADPSLLVPAQPFVASVMFGEENDVQAFANVRDDTVFVSITGHEPVEMSGVLLELVFDVATEVPAGTKTPLTWIPFPASNIGEIAPELVDGRLVIGMEMYGDVTGNGTVSPQDAAEVLKYLVRLTPSIDQKLADVTGNGFVSAQDAFLILRRAIDPSIVFPIEQQVINQRVASSKECHLTWVNVEGRWELVADDAGAIESGELQLVSDSPIDAEVVGADMTYTRRDGDMLRVAFVRLQATDNMVLRVISATQLAAPPQVSFAQFNEGQYPVNVRPESATVFELLQNTPNPFNPSTTLRFALPEAGHVTLAVYDVNGRLVRTLVGQAFLPGQHSVTWDGCDNTGRAVASGVYLARLTAPQGVVTKRMVLAR